MKRSRYEIYEEMLSELFQEEDLDVRIEEMEKQIQDYQTDLSEGSDSLKQELERKLEFYKIFKENERQIINIRKFQRTSQEQLKLLNEELKALSEKASVVGDILKKEKRAITSQRNRNIKKQEFLEKESARKDLSEKEQLKLREEREKLSDAMDANYKRYVAFMEGDEFKTKREEYENSKKRIRELKRKITKINVTMSECNAIWSCLIKGKKWDDIQVVLQKGKFTAPKGTNIKIYQISELEGEKSFKKQNEIPETIVTEPQNKEQENQNESQEKDETQEQIGAFVRGILDEEQKDNETKKLIEQAQKQLYKNMRAQRIEMAKKKRLHNPLYKNIPFIAKILNKIDARRIDKELLAMKESVMPLKNVPVAEQSAQEIKEVWSHVLNKMEKNSAKAKIDQTKKKLEYEERLKEYSNIDYFESQTKKRRIELYKQIADKGLTESVEDSKEQDEKKAIARQAALEKRKKQQEEKAKKVADKKEEKTSITSNETGVDESDKDKEWKKTLRVDDKTQKKIEYVLSKAEKEAAILRAKETLKSNREKTANLLAEREGGRYEVQDGATSKKIVNTLSNER